MICHVNLVLGDPTFGQTRWVIPATRRPNVRGFLIWRGYDQVGFRVDGIHGNTQIPPSPMLP